MSDPVASVQVAVTPDAKDFFRRFEEQTRGDAAEAGARDGREYGEAFNRGVGRPTIRPDVDTTQARAQLAALNREGSQNGVSLGKILATLAPALVPISGAAATAAAGFGALGVAGILAVKGIKAELASGSQIGVAYAGQVAVAKNAVDSLQKTAAKGFFGGFQSSIGKLSTQLPAFNVEVAKSSTALGQITSHVTGGLVAGFTTFAPVIDAAEAAFVKLSAEFEHFASTANGQKFAQNLVADFQQVLPLIENLSGAIVKLVVAAAPVGGALVSVISDLAAALNAIPTPVLTALVTTFTALGAARLASTGIAKLSVSLSGVGAGAAGAGRNVGVLGTALGRITPYIATVLAAQVAVKSADNATKSWATSSNQFAAGLQNSTHAVGEILSGDFAKGFSDLVGSGAAKAKAYSEQINALRSSFNSLVAPAAKAKGVLAPFDRAAVANNLKSTATPFVYGGKVQNETVFGKGGALTVGQQIDSARVKEYTKDLQALTKTQSAFYAQVAGSSSISGLPAQYTAQATALQSVAGAQLKLLSSGSKLKGVYDGVAISTGAYNAAVQKAGGNGAVAVGVIQGQVEGYKKNAAAAKEAAVESLRLGNAVGSAAAKYKLTSDQIDLYTHVAGINATQVAQGVITQKQFTAAIGQVATAVANGSTSLNGYVAAIAQFNSTGDTAASRGQLIGATLKAANGPLLDYANTMVQAATANQQLVTDFGNTSKSVLNLKKGTIDFHNAAAAPLLSDLANLQTAAVNSAAATYQYETSQGKASAGADAFSVYVNNTKGALEREFAQMGLTKTQADKLATSYFGIKNSGDLKKQIGLIGQDKVLTALQGILSDLDILAGKSVLIPVDVDDAAANAKLQSIRNQLAGLSGLGANQTRSKAEEIAGRYAVGTNGRGLPPGVSSVGEQGAELALNYGSHVEILSHAQSRAYIAATGIKAPGFASGTNPGGESGGYTGVKYGGGPSKTSTSSGSSSAKQSASVKKTAADLKSALDSVKSALSGFNQALYPTASSIQTAASTLLAAARAAKLTKSEAAAFGKRQAQLSTAESSYNSVVNRLGSAPTAPSAYDKLATAQQAYTDTKTSVSSAITGGFNIGTAGVNAQVYNDQAAAPVSASSILADLTKSANNASRFGAALKTLAKNGLPQQLLLQLAQAGPDALPQALALQDATPSQISGIGAQYKTLTGAAGTAGTLLASDLNSAGVAAAQGLIAGLKSQEGALKKQMQSLADAMTKQIKKDLGIHSPSRVFHDLGSFTGEGFRLGIESKVDAVRRAGHGLAYAATPNVQGMALRSDTTAGSRRGGVELNVYPAASLDEVAVGNVAANRLMHALAGL